MTLLWVPYAIQGREGWMFGGNAKFVPGPKPRKFWDTATYVCAQTEGSKGGYFNSINMYDMAIISVGVLNWAGAIPGSPMLRFLRALYDQNPTKFLGYLSPALKQSGAEITSTDNGMVKTLNIKHNNKIVITKEDWCDLINKGAPGFIGKWTIDQKAYSKVWAECFTFLLADPEFYDAHRKYYLSFIKNTLFLNFTFSVLDPILQKKVMVNPAKLLTFDDSTIESEDPYKKALIITYLSYAANLPANALEKLNSALVKNKDKSWKEKLQAFVDECTTKTTIKEWPSRWGKIYPTLQEDLGISLENDDKQKDKTIDINIPIFVDTFVPNNQVEKKEEEVVILKTFWQNILEWLLKIFG